MRESGLTEIIPLICTLAIWSQYPVFSHPEPPQGAPWRGVVATAAEWWMVGTLFLSWVPSGLTVRAAVMRWLNSCNNLCLLIWQATFFHWQVYSRTTTRVSGMEKVNSQGFITDLFTRSSGKTPGANLSAKLMQAMTARRHKLLKSNCRANTYIVQANVKPAGPI